MNVEVRLTAITSSHCSSFITMNRLSLVRPALLTRMSSAPELGDRLVDELGDLVALVPRSQGSTCTRSPSSLASASSLSAWRRRRQPWRPAYARPGNGAADAAGGAGDERGLACQIEHGLSLSAFRAGKRRIDVGRRAEARGVERGSMRLARPASTLPAPIS